MDNKNLFYIFLAVFILLGVNVVFGGITSSLVSPGDNTWNLSNSIQFTFSCTGNYSAYNATLYIDGKSNKTYGNLSGIVVNNSNTNITITLNDKSSYLWNVECANASGVERYQASANYTLKIDTIDPSVALNVPGDNTWNLSNSVYFAFTVTESNPAECNLTINGANNKTNSTAITSDSRYTYTAISIEDSISYLWNVLCYDQARRAKRATANFTLKVDATAPSAGSITMPKVTNIYSQNQIKISCSGADTTSGVNNVKLKITKPSKTTVEYTLDSGEEKIFRATETGEVGLNLVDCTIYDVAGNTLATEQNNFNVYHRSVKSADIIEEEPKEEVTPTPEEGGVPTEGEPTEGAPVSKAWIWVVVIIAIVLVLYFVLKKKK